MGLATLLIPSPCLNTFAGSRSKSPPLQTEFVVIDSAAEMIDDAADSTADTELPIDATKEDWSKDAVVEAAGSV